MTVQVEGRPVEVSGDASAASVLQQALSGKKFKAVVAASAATGDTRTLLDLSAPLPEGCTALEPVYADSPEGLAIVRHSTAHVMAAAVKKLFPAAKVTIGPAIDNGFYYDFFVDRPFSSDDFEAIEAEMQRIAEARLPFERTSMSKGDAVRKFSDMGENFKVEIINDIDADTGGYNLHSAFATGALAGLNAAKALLAAGA